ncbi:MAG TPA: hypothetical protein VH619_13650 [Verrucomicrobiae bacterium]|nr:hypothetical protein [Verrucomicrobiae bacterium]
MQPRINPGIAQQGFVRAAFDNPPVRQNQSRLANGAQAVRDHERRPPPQQNLQRPLQPPLLFVVLGISGTQLQLPSANRSAIHARLIVVFARNQRGQPDPAPALTSDFTPS